MNHTAFSFPAILFILIICPFIASSQKVMKINDSLKNNCEMMEVKAGGLRAIHRYEFGPYRVVSGKAGITTTKSNSKFFSRFTQSESTQKSSFVFVGNTTDTVLVNTFTSSKIETKTTRSLVFGSEGARVERGNELQNGVDSFVAVISLPDDTTDWQLISSAQYKASDNYKSNWVLTDGKTEIEIRKVIESDNGKKSLLWLSEGYEFFLDNKSIAAVQTMMKQFVWFSKDLNQNMKLIIASAAATLLVKSL